jgi:hypoxanthine phosphoribosyltransferase
MSEWQLILFDVLEEFKVLSGSTVELAKEYVKLAKECSEKAKIIENLAKKYKMDYSQVIEKIDAARYYLQHFMTYINEMKLGITPSQKKKELEMRVKHADPEIRYLFQEQLETFDRDMGIIKTYNERKTQLVKS